MGDTDVVTMESPTQSGVLTMGVNLGRADFELRKLYASEHRSLFSAAVTEKSERVQRGDPLMKTGNLDDEGAEPDKAVPVRANFNGVPVSQKVNLEAAWEEVAENTVFFGVAINDNQFTATGSTTRQITTQYGGIITMYNTGTVAISPGALVAIRPPAPDLHDLQPLPSTAGLPADQKVRPVTYQFDFNMSAMLQSGIKNSPKKGRGSLAPAVDVLSAKSTADSKRATWRALAALNGVGLCMVDYADYELTQRGSSLREAGQLLGRTLFGAPGGIGMGATTAVLCGVPWTESLPDLVVMGRETISLNKLREKLFAEWQRRIQEPGAAFGNTDLDPTRGATGLNPFYKQKVTARSSTVRSQCWDKYGVNFATAVAAVENVPDLLVIGLRRKMHIAARQVVGRVIKGGGPGCAMDVCLIGSCVPFS